MSYPGVVCSRVSSIRVWRTLESMVTAVAMESRVQKLPRVRGGSYTGEAVEVFINTVSEKYLYTSPEPEKPEKYLYIYIHFTIPFQGRRSIYLHHAGEVFIHFSGAREAGEVFIYTPQKYTTIPAVP